MYLPDNATYGEALCEFENAYRNSLWEYQDNVRTLQGQVRELHDIVEWILRRAAEGEEADRG